MIDKKPQRKNVQIAARVRSLARFASGRIYTSTDGVYIVSGLPIYDQFSKCLKNINEAPKVGEEPTPIELGFAPSDIRPVTENEISTWVSSLALWKKIVKNKSSKKMKNIEGRKKVKDWTEEITFLETRINLIRSQLERIKTNSLTLKYIYIPADVNYINIEERFKILAAGRYLSPLWVFYAVIVGWTAGREATDRFLNILKSLSITRQQQEEVRWVQRLKENAFEWKKRNLGQQHITNEIQNFIDQIPFHLQTKININPPRRPRDSDVYLEYIIKRCEELLQEKFNIPDSIRVAAVATLVALDDARAPIPDMLIRGNCKLERLFRVIEALLKQSNEKYYDKLIGALDSIGIDYDPDVFKNVRQMIEKGSSVEDISWLLKQDKYGDYLDDFVLSGNSPKTLHLFRLFVQFLNKRHLYISRRDVEHALNRLLKTGNFWFVETLLLWCEKVPEKSFNKKMVRTTWNTFLSALSSSIYSKRFRRILRQWALMEHQIKMPGVPEWIQQETHTWLNHLAFYQSLSQEETGLPDSIRKLLYSDRKVEEEIHYLNVQNRKGALSESAQIRLKTLEARREKPDRIPQDKILRETQELCAQTALSVLREIINSETPSQWSDFFRVDPPGHLKSHHCVEIVYWFSKLNKKEKEKCSELLEKWKRYGSSYRKYLIHNKLWISKAESMGVNINELISPQDKEIVINGKKIRICAGDPFSVFLMGSYFDTCLSIDEEGENRATVITNAYDANKIVIFGLNETGIVVARKLLAVNKVNKLIGFRTYANLKEPDANILASAIDKYCAEWAARSGLKLSDTGKPENLCGLYWYDDGNISWSKETYRLWSDTAEFDTSTLFNIAHQYKNDWISVLKRVDLWDIDDDDNIETVLEKSPEIVEEALAIVSREKEDLELAKLLEKYTRTGSGSFEAMISKFQLSNGEGVDRYVDDIEYNEGEKLIRIIEVLVRLHGTQAFRTLVKIYSRRYDCSILNFVYFAHKTNEFTGKFIDLFLRAKDKSIFSGNLIIILSVIQNKIVGKLPDKFLYQLTFRIMTDTDIYYWSYVSWMPNLTDPKKFISRKDLNLMWNSADSDDLIPDEIEEKRITLVLWCLKNVCTATVQMLLEKSKKNTSALLALALIYPDRFAGYIEKTVVKHADDPASVMALFIVKGEEEAMKILSGKRFHHYPKRKEYLHLVRDLYRAYNALDWETISIIKQRLRSYNINFCLPLLMRQLWSILENNNLHTTCGITLKEEAKAVKESGVNVTGLIVELVKKLDECEDQNLHKKIKDIVRHLIQVQEISAERLLWINMLSKDKLFRGVKLTDWEEQEIHFLGNNIAGIYDLFFDNRGDLREVADIPWEKHYAVPPIPGDIDKAYEYINLLVKKADGEDPRKVFHLKPSNELQNRLIDKNLLNR